MDVRYGLYECNCRAVFIRRELYGSLVRTLWGKCRNWIKGKGIKGIEWTVCNIVCVFSSRHIYIDMDAFSGEGEEN